MIKPYQRTIPISKNGRINLPADMRRALGLSGAGHLIVTLTGDEIRITTARQALKRVRELASPYKPTEGLASGQLIKERRAEAAREDANAEAACDD
jgi:AbrB family looped-hinge helix DNA binding protein